MIQPPNWYAWAKAQVELEARQPQPPRRTVADEVTVIRPPPVRRTASVRYQRTDWSDQDRRDRRLVLNVGVYLTTFCVTVWAFAIAVTVGLT